MVSSRKKRIAEIPSGAENPLTFALAQRDGDTLAMVQQAVTHDQTLLAFQPVVQSAAPNQTAFYEGLIRVLDPSGRTIPAKDFMLAAEDTAVGREIDVISLKKGLRALRQTPSLRLAINMSARSIGYRPWIQTLRQSLQRYPLIGERLILEITESSAMTVPELVVEFMDEMQPLGVCFALDNYGAGFTAIRYFKDFFFDVLKIDGQFCQGIAESADNRAITKALLSVAKHFEMLTVAERVETPQDAAVLTELGVDCLQGFYFSAPTTQPPWLKVAAARRA